MKLAWILIFGFYFALVILIYARLIHRWWRGRRDRRVDSGRYRSV